MSCLGTNYLPNPPHTWYRVQNSMCTTPTGDIDLNQLVRSPLTGKYIPLKLLDYDLSMLKKGNILQYKINSSNLSQTQRYSKIAQGKWTNRNTTWATQSQTYSNPNTNSLKRVNGQTVTLDGVLSDLGVSCPNNSSSILVNSALPSIGTSSTTSTTVINPVLPKLPTIAERTTDGVTTIPLVSNSSTTPTTVVQDFGSLLCNVTEDICTGLTSSQPANEFCNPSSESDVPGNVEKLCWNDGLQTWYPRQRYTMT